MVQAPYGMWYKLDGSGALWNVVQVGWLRRLMECDAVQYGTSLPTFRRNLLFLSSILTYSSKFYFRLEDGSSKIVRDCGTQPLCCR
jgi:hypothetical protein